MPYTTVTDDYKQKNWIRRISGREEEGNRMTTKARHAYCVACSTVDGVSCFHFCRVNSDTRDGVAYKNSTRVTSIDEPKQNTLTSSPFYHSNIRVHNLHA